MENKHSSCPPWDWELKIRSGFKKLIPSDLFDQSKDFEYVSTSFFSWFLLFLSDGSCVPNGILHHFDLILTRNTWHMCYQQTKRILPSAPMATKTRFSRCDSFGDEVEFRLCCLTYQCAIHVFLGGNLNPANEWFTMNIENIGKTLISWKGWEGDKEGKLKLCM